MEIVLAPLFPTGSPHLAFVITTPVGTERAGVAGRVASLEARLRRIAAEVAAAGIDGRTSSPVLRHDVVDVLSPRQAEIAERLAAGKRVPTIAREAGLSQSTVRNHLSQIFQKFGVASQAELIEVLHEGSDPRYDTAPRNK
jgi:DNA-binding NarL/FixJ family response regulator